MTEIVFILDRSGSMAGLEKDTICSFNSMIEKQRRQEGDAYISTVLFDNYSEVIHDRVHLDMVPKLTEEDYYVRGCTALLDAVVPYIISGMSTSIPGRRTVRKRPFLLLLPTEWKIPVAVTAMKRCVP